MSFLEAVGGIVIAILALVVLILLTMFVTNTDLEDLSLCLWVSSLILYITVVLLWMFGVPFPKF